MDIEQEVVQDHTAVNNPENSPHRIGLISYFHGNTCENWKAALEDTYGMLTCNSEFTQDCVEVLFVLRQSFVPERLE